MADHPLSGSLLAEREGINSTRFEDSCLNMAQTAPPLQPATHRPGAGVSANVRRQDTFVREDAPALLADKRPGDGVCVGMCAVKIPFCEKSLPHSLQTKRRGPVCVQICTVKMLEVENGHGVRGAYPQKALCGGIPDPFLEPLTRSWSHFVGIYRQKLTDSVQN